MPCKARQCWIYIATKQRWSLLEHVLPTVDRDIGTGNKRCFI